MRLADLYLNPFTFVGNRNNVFFTAQIHIFRTLCNNADVTLEKGTLITTWDYGDYRAFREKGRRREKKERAFSAPGPSRFSLTFSRSLPFTTLLYLGACNRLSSTWAVISKKNFTGQYYSSLKELIEGFLVLSFLQKQFLQSVSKFQMKSYILNHDFTS